MSAALMPSGIRRGSRLAARQQTRHRQPEERLSAQVTLRNLRRCGGFCKTGFPRAGGVRHSGWRRVESCSHGSTSFFSDQPPVDQPGAGPDHGGSLVVGPLAAVSDCARFGWSPGWAAPAPVGCWCRSGLMLAVGDGLVAGPLKHLIHRPRPWQAMAGVRQVDLARHARPRCLALVPATGSQFVHPARAGQPRSTRVRGVRFRRATSSTTFARRWCWRCFTGGGAGCISCRRRWWGIRAFTWARIGPAT